MCSIGVISSHAIVEAKRPASFLKTLIFVSFGITEIIPVTLIIDTAYAGPRERISRVERKTMVTQTYF